MNPTSKDILIKHLGRNPKGEQIDMLVEELAVKLDMYESKIKELQENKGLYSREWVSVFGTDFCDSCTTGRITLYAHSRICVECENKRVSE